MRHSSLFPKFLSASLFEETFKVPFTFTCEIVREVVDSMVTETMKQVATMGLPRSGDMTGPGNLPVGPFCTPTARAKRSVGLQESRSPSCVAASPDEAGGYENQCKISVDPEQQYGYTVARTHPGHRMYVAVDLQAAEGRCKTFEVTHERGIAQRVFCQQNKHKRQANDHTQV